MRKHALSDFAVLNCSDVDETKNCFKVWSCCVYRALEGNLVVYGSFPKSWNPNIDPQNTLVLVIGTPRKGNHHNSIRAEGNKTIAWSGLV